jgi:hypothetical protein
MHVALPADLFSAQEGGPDLILRVDVDAVKQQLEVAWQAMLAEIEQFWQAALQKAVADQALSSADQVTLTASLTMMQKGLRQFLEDLFLGEMRLTLAPAGWMLDVETKMRPGSPSAAFLNAQAGRTSRAAQLFAPSPSAFLRFVYNVRMTETLRQEATALSPALRQMLEARLTALPGLTQKQSTAGMEAIATYFSLLERWYTHKELEVAAEMRVQDTSFELTGWLPFVESRRALHSLLTIAEQVPLWTDNATAKVTRDVAQHQGTALHRLEVPGTDRPDVPNSAFVAAQEPFLTFHLGNTPAPLQGLLDRMRALTTPVPTQTDALLHMELFLAPMLQLGLSKGPMDSQDPINQALFDKLRQGPNEPFVMDLLTRQDAATLRATFPGVLIRSAAEVMGQQITQQLRGSGEKKGSGAEKKSGAGKSRP